MYVLKWKNPALVINGITDANKEMPINVLPASVVVDKAPIKFTGKGAGNYGQIQQENLMRLLENFADTELNPPEHPTVGMTWYDTTNSQLKLCVQTAPVKWRVLAGIIVTNVNQPAPTGQLGDIWFERTGPLSGYLYVYTGTGRYPLSAGLGGWNQIWPAPDAAGGREEYDAMLVLLEKLIGSPTVGGNGAITRSIQNLSSLLQLDEILRERYENSPDLILSPLAGDLNLLKVDPVSSDWDTLLAAIKYAVNRLDVPQSIKNGISDFPFVQDGRQAPESLFDLDDNDTRYPVALRRVLRKMGYVTMTRLYATTMAALEQGVIDRYSIQGINGGTLHPTATKTSHVIFGGSQLNRGTTSNLRLAFRFADKDSQERFLFSGGAVQITMRHSTSQLGSPDQALSTFLSGNGGFRITADRVRVFNNAFATSSMVVSNLGLNDATSAGKLLATVTTDGGPVVKITAFKISDVRIDVDISLQVPIALNGKTTFKYEIIEDTEKYLVGTTEKRVFPGVLPYAAGDASGSSWYVVDTSDQPPPVNVPVGTLLYTICGGTSMNGVFADGNGGTYTSVLQANSPQCGGTACSSNLYGNGSIAVPSKVTAITMSGKAGASAPVVATVDGQTKSFTTSTSATSTVTFTSNTAGKTLTFTIPVGGELSMTYCDFVPAPPKPEGELLRTECRGVDKWGIYADGNYGETSRIITANSAECGYIGNDPSATFSVTYATFGGASQTVPWNSAFNLVVGNIAGFTPGQTFTVTTTLTGASSRTETLGTFTAASNGTASNVSKTFSNNGTWTAGTYSATTVIKNSAGTTVLTIGPSTFAIAANSATLPTVQWYMKGSQTPNQAANVGDNITVKADGAKFAPNTPVSFYIDMTGADARTTGPYAYTSDGNGNVSFTFTHTLLLNSDITGDVTYRVRAIGNDTAGTSKTVTSNAITITWTKVAPPPKIVLFMNGSQNAAQTAQVGDVVTVRQDMSDFGPNVPITMYMDIAGADNRTVGPFAFTTDASGFVTHTYTSTLLANATIRGVVSYKLRATGNDKAGISKSVTSNQISITWSKVAATPKVDLFFDNSQSNRSAVAGTSILVKFASQGWAPNTPISYYLEISGAENRTTGPFNYTTSASGTETNSHYNSLLLSVSTSGTISYRLRAVANDENGVQKTIYSNTISVYWASPDPLLSHTTNYSAGYSTAYVGDNVQVTITGSRWRPNSQITLYLYITGAENRTSGPFTHTADANGNLYNSFSSTLVGSPNVNGTVYYTWSATGTKLDGSYANVSSNQSAVNWRTR